MEQFGFGEGHRPVGGNDHGATAGSIAAEGLHPRFGAMLVAEEAGMVRALRKLILMHEEYIRTRAVSSEIRVLEDLIRRVVDAEAVEAHYGEGSLINLDHPLVKNAVKRKQAFTSAELEAATRMRELHPKLLLGWLSSAMSLSRSVSGPNSTSPAAS